MEKIRDLFDQNKDIYRTIEKVITYDASEEHRLKAEISEYVATESIEEQFDKLLTKMQIAMEEGGQNEVGVWVSGFYGSGKSSFTKYLGLSFDSQVQIDGVPFLQHLQNRFIKPQTKALLSTVTKRFPAAVILLDLASEMLAGATMADVSTVLFYKVLQFAGYSQNLKVASLERKLRKDGRYDEFKQSIQDALGVPWSTVQNDPLVVDSMIPEIAHQMYPALFKTPAAFSTETSDFIQFENERVEEMLDIVRDATGKQHIIFIIDEVGQYIGSRENLILNLDGPVKWTWRLNRGSKPRSGAFSGTAGKSTGFLAPERPVLETRSQRRRSDHGIPPVEVVPAQAMAEETQRDLEKTGKGRLRLGPLGLQYLA